MKSKYRSNSEKSLNKDIEGYLKRINFDERLSHDDFSCRELKKILLNNLRRYFCGEMSWRFVARLGGIINLEFFWFKDDVFRTVSSILDDLDWEEPKSKKEIEKIFRSALGMLEKDLKKGFIKD